MRHNLKPNLASRRSKGEAVESSTVTCAEQEFPMSTSAVLFILARWSRHKGVQGWSATSRARGLLRVIVDRIVREDSFSWAPEQATDGFAFRFEFGKIDASQAVAGNNKLSRMKCFKSKSEDVPDFLMSLMDVDVSHRHAKATHCFAKEMAAKLCECLAVRFDIMDCVDRDCDNYTRMPPLRFGCEAKSRRVSTLKTLDYVQAAKDDAQVRSPSTLAAAQRWMAKRKGEPLEVHPASAKRWHRDTMYSYFLGMRQMWSDCTHVSLVGDAGAVGKLTLWVCAAYSVEKHCGSWGPPTVPRV